MLQARWRTPLASELRFASHTEEAVRIAERLSGASQTQPLTWVHLTFSHDNEDHPELEDYYGDPDTVLAQDTIAELVGDDADEDEGEDEGADEVGPQTDADPPIAERASPRTVGVVGSSANPDVAPSHQSRTSLQSSPWNPIGFPGPCPAGSSSDETPSDTHAQVQSDAAMIVRVLQLAEDADPVSA